MGPRGILRWYVASRSTLGAFHLRGRQLIPADSSGALFVNYSALPGF